MTFKAVLILMNHVNYLAHYFLLRRKLLKSTQTVNVLHLSSNNLSQIFAMCSIYFIGPDRVQVLKKQEVAKINLLLSFLCLVDVSSNKSLLEGLLHNEVLRDLSEQISQIPFFLDVILQKYEVISHQRGCHTNLIQNKVKLASVGNTDQFKLSKVTLNKFIYLKVQEATSRQR